MAQAERKSNTRFRIAIALFLLAIITPFLLSIASSKSEQYWALARPIPHGSKISAEDLTKLAARIETGASSYLTSDVDPIGAVTTRSFLAGELLDARFLSDASNSNLEEVSIAIAASDIPMATALGDFVSIFQLHDSQNGEPALPPIRVLTRAFISDLNRKGSNFGNTITVTLALDEDQVPLLLAASSKGRLVVVGKNG